MPTDPQRPSDSSGRTARGGGRVPMGNNRLRGRGQESLRAKGARLRRTWRGRGDAENALLLAFEIVDGHWSDVDLDADYETVSLACEVLWDVEHGRVDQALRLIRRWRRRVQRERLTARRVDAETPFAREVRALRLWARALHRAPDSEAAWTIVHMAYGMLCEAAGGSHVLSARVAVRPFEGIALLYTELLGIAPAIGRRLGRAAGPLMATFMHDAEVVARQIPLDGRRFPERHALVNQLLFAVLERNDPARDRQLVQLLYDLDAVTRPLDARGQVTRFSLYSEVADYFGEHERALLYRKRARSALRRFKLYRHITVTDALYPLRDAS